MIIFIRMTNMPYTTVLTRSTSFDRCLHIPTLGHPRDSRVTISDTDMDTKVRTSMFWRLYKMC